MSFDVEFELRCDGWPYTMCNHPSLFGSTLHGVRGMAVRMGWTVEVEDLKRQVTDLCPDCSERKAHEES